MDDKNLIEGLQRLKNPVGLEESKREVWQRIQGRSPLSDRWLQLAAVMATAILVLSINYRFSTTEKPTTYVEDVEEYSLELYGALLTGAVEADEAIEMFDGTYTEAEDDTDERLESAESDLIADAQSLDQLTEDYAELLFGVSSQTLTEN